MRRAWPALCCLLLCGCVKYPEPYRPPEQRKPLELRDATRLGYFTAMNSPHAPEHFVSDVLPELHDGAWRWVMQCPTFQFQLPVTRSMRLLADITVPEITFKQTGPVQITVHVSGRLLGTIEVAKPGQLQWEKDVPEGWLTTERPVLVRMAIDKLWTSPEDGARRGFIITRLGFVQ
ncbi:MAG: hypothetical protein HY858_03350 [Candidatus Solibacter usitatus]|nr:hypothetical protein [Candidatus Solibacter usitatus]